MALVCVIHKGKPEGVEMFVSELGHSVCFVDFRRCLVRWFVGDAAKLKPRGGNEGREEGWCAHTSKQDRGCRWVLFRFTSWS